jgi:predicted MPP superfamily phosphohydrolase
MKSLIKKITRLIFVLVLAGMIFWSFYYEPSRLVVNNYPLKLQKWSAKQNGLKIVAISDIHGGSNFVTEERIRKVVRETNAQNPDIIVLLGDYLSRQFFNRNELKMPLETVMENLKGLQAKYGVYAVIGNHDNEFGGAKVREGLENIGYKVLENEVATINYNGEWIRLLGIDDVLKAGNLWQKISDDLKSVLNKSEAKAGKIIVLTHNPDAIAYLTEELSISDDFSLLIAGHTHGGQCRFPLIGAPVVPSEFEQKYAAGHVRDKGIDVFVTTGIGMSVLPVRFGVPPEIAVLELYSE